MSGMYCRIVYATYKIDRLAINANCKNSSYGQTFFQLLRTAYWLDMLEVNKNEKDVNDIVLMFLFLF